MAQIIYGIKVADDKDPYLEVAEFAVDGMARAGNAGAYLVDTLPIRELPAYPQVSIGRT